MIGDQGVLLADAQMIDGAAWSRPLRQREGQGAGDEHLPAAGVAASCGLDHPALHGAVPLDSGHYDPHQTSLSHSGASGSRTM